MSEPRSTGAATPCARPAIETMRALWAPGTKPYAGARIELPETTCYPRPAVTSRSSWAVPGRDPDETAVTVLDLPDLAGADDVLALAPLLK
jgi:hypothetical protein